MNPKNRVRLMRKDPGNRIGAMACLLAAGVVYYLSAAAEQSAPEEQRSATRSEILARRKALMERLEKGSQDKLNVPPTDGQLLRILVEATRARKALELGSSYGYSALWIGSGLEQTGGHLWTVEIDAGRAKECRENIREAGLEKTVTCIEDDAFKAIPQLAKEGPWDFVFLDAWKSDYKRYLDVLLPQMKPGGVIVAHNTIERAGEMPDYLEAVFHRPDLDSVTLSTTEWKCGLTLTYVKKNPPSASDAAEADAVGGKPQGRGGTRRSKASRPEQVGVEPDVPRRPDQNRSGWNPTLPKIL